MSEHEGVEPAYIAEQREAGWPDIHPEDYCHRCGNLNPLWVADRADWLAATSAWAAETGREGICCPSCFAEMHAEQTGRETVWRLARHDALADMTRQRDEAVKAFQRERARVGRVEALADEWAVLGLSARVVALRAALTGRPQS